MFYNLIINHVQEIRIIINYREIAKENIGDINVNPKNNGLKIIIYNISAKGEV
jgi:hypothetical protein